jgi:hypothetical protein
MKRTLRVCLIASLSVWLAAAFAAGCGAGVPTERIRSGLRQGAGDSVEVVGYLGRSDAEGGAWVVYATDPGKSSTSMPAILAVLRPGSNDMAYTSEIDGRYVWAAGRLSSGVGQGNVPSILVDAVDVVQAP